MTLTLSPDSAKRRTSVTVSITGQNTQFTSGYTSVSLRRTGASTLYSSSSSVTNATQMTATFTVPNSATVGKWDILISSPFPPYVGTAEAFRIDDQLGVEDERPTRPTRFALLQNYPNPFNPETVISYELIKNSAVSLKVFDVLGRNVETLVDESKPIGQHSVRFNASRLTSGVYFYRLQAGDYIETKKMLLMK